MFIIQPGMLEYAGQRVCLTEPEGYVPTMTPAAIPVCSYAGAWFSRRVNAAALPSNPSALRGKHADSPGQPGYWETLATTCGTSESPVL